VKPTYNSPFLTFDAEVSAEGAETQLGHTRAAYATKVASFLNHFMLDSCQAARGVL
jgi:hypothetical protein